MYGRSLRLIICVVAVLLSTATCTVSAARCQPGFTENSATADTLRAELRAVVERMHARNLLTDQGREEALWWILSGKLTTRAYVLAYLREDEMRKTYPEWKPFSIFNPMVAVRPDTSASLRRTLRSRADTLRATGVLTSSAHARLVHAVERGEIVTRSSFTSYATRIMMREEAVLAYVLHPSLQRLRRLNVLSATDHASLLHASDAGELASAADVLERMPRGVMIDIREDGGMSVLGVLDEVLGQAADALQDGGIDTLQIQDPSLRFSRKDERGGRGSVAFDAVSAATIEGLRYADRKRLYVDSSAVRDSEPPPTTDLVPIARVLLNKALRDRRSPYRFHQVSLVPPTGSDHRENPYGGLLALTQAQYEALSSGLPVLQTDFDVQYAYRAPEFTTGRVQQIVDGLRRAGLLDHLSETERASAQTRLSQRLVVNTLNVFRAFDGIIMSFPSEMWGDNPYVEITNDLAEIARGHVDIHTIEGTFSYREGPASIAFSVGGIRYEMSPRVRGDWMDPEYRNLIAQTVQDKASGGRLYWTSDSHEMLIFLTDRERRLLARENLLSPEPMTF